MIFSHFTSQDINWQSFKTKKYVYWSRRRPGTGARAGPRRRRPSRSMYSRAPARGGGGGAARRTSPRRTGWCWRRGAERPPPRHPQSPLPPPSPRRPQRPPRRATWAWAAAGTRAAPARTRRYAPPCGTPGTRGWSSEIPQPHDLTHFVLRRFYVTKWFTTFQLCFKFLPLVWSTAINSPLLDINLS